MDKNAKIRKLTEEREKITEILMGLKNMFYGDLSIRDKVKRKSIYTLIKLDILNNILRNEDQADRIVYENSYFLQNIINNINCMQNAQGIAE